MKTVKFSHSRYSRGRSEKKTAGNRSTFLRESLTSIARIASINVKAILYSPSSFARSTRYLRRRTEFFPIRFSRRIISSRSPTVLVINNKRITSIITQFITYRFRVLISSGEREISTLMILH